MTEVVQHSLQTRVSSYSQTSQISRIPGYDFVYTRIICRYNMLTRHLGLLFSFKSLWTVFFFTHILLYNDHCSSEYYCDENHLNVLKESIPIFSRSFTLRKLFKRSRLFSRGGRLHRGSRNLLWGNYLAWGNQIVIPKVSSNKGFSS